MANGFVVKAMPHNVRSGPRWLLEITDGPHAFGTRDKARVFPTQELAAAEAKRWGTILKPARLRGRRTSLISQNSRAKPQLSSRMRPHYPLTELRSAEPLVDGRLDLSQASL